MPGLRGPGERAVPARTGSTPARRSANTSARIWSNSRVSPPACLVAWAMASTCDHAAAALSLDRYVPDRELVPLENSSVLHVPLRDRLVVTLLGRVRLDPQHQPTQPGPDLRRGAPGHFGQQPGQDPAEVRRVDVGQFGADQFRSWSSPAARPPGPRYTAGMVSIAAIAVSTSAPAA